MKISEWRDHVGSSASKFDDNKQSSLQLFDLSALTIVDVTGEDASSFLQGQFCNDLAVVSETHAQITGYCTPKGRLLALPLIVGIHDGFRLLIPEEVVEPFIKRLSMFVMRSKVTITQRDDWVSIGISTDSDSLGLTDDRSHEQLQDLPKGVMSVTTAENHQILRWHDDLTASESCARFVLLANIEDQMVFWDECSQAPKHDILRWRAADVSAGVPSVHQGVVEAFVPQMVNLQLINGLSFTKGCYPGQEIVARMQYLGKLKRHMRLFNLDLESEAAVPKPGDNLNTDVDSDAAVVVDAQAISEKQALILAVVKVSANNATLQSAGNALANVALPYDLPTLVEAAAVSESGA